MQVTLRNYSGRSMKNDYTRELAARLLLAAVVRQVYQMSFSTVSVKSNKHSLIKNGGIDLFKNVVSHIHVQNKCLYTASASSAMVVEKY